MPWYFYLLEFLGGALLANSVPHFVQGVSGNPFPTPFSNPPGRGDSSPLVNTVWGFGNFVAGAILLYFFWPRGAAVAGWFAIALGVLALAVQSSLHFGAVRAGKL